MRRLDKYLYVDGDTNKIRLLGLAGVLSVLLLSYGYFLFLTLSPIYLLIFGPIAAFFIYSKLIRYFIQVFYPSFDSRKHEKFISSYWEDTPEPSVDIFLPYAGEETSVYEKVVRAAKKIDDKNKKIYLLDDFGNNTIRDLAGKYEVNYLSRPDKGFYKKAGNLKFGYENSKGKYIFVLDADFVPTKDSLREIIPYIAIDPSIGILQTPQYFDQDDKVHARSKIEFGGGNIVEEFYRIDLPSRNKFNASMCVGTSAIYRREAIEKTGGPPLVSSTEDVRQGLKITRGGFRVSYLPLIVSKGTSPETLQGYFRQHNRWCSGSLTILTDGYLRDAKIGIVAKALFLSNSFYYLSEAFSVIFPFHLLCLLAFQPESLNIFNMIWFLPYLVINRIVSPTVRKHRMRRGTRIAALSNVFTYLYTILTLILGKTLTWEPAGLKVKKGLSAYVTAINLGVLVSSLFILTFIAILFNNPSLMLNLNAYPTLILAFYITYWYVVFLKMASDFIYRHLAEEQLNFKIRLAVPYLRKMLMPALALTMFATVIIDGAFVAQTNELKIKVADEVYVLELNTHSDTQTDRQIVPSEYLEISKLDESTLSLK